MDTCSINVISQNYTDAPPSYEMSITTRSSTAVQSAPVRPPMPVDVKNSIIFAIVTAVMGVATIFVIVMIWLWASDDI